MDMQKVFDKVVDHLLEQRKQSTVNDVLAPGGYRCMYRGNSGLKCAIGALIPDDLYTSSMENAGVGYMLLNNPKLAKHLDIKIGKKRPSEGDTAYKEERLLIKLQNIHDVREVEEWEKLLRDLAWDYELQFQGEKSWR